MHWETYWRLKQDSHCASRKLTSDHTWDFVWDEKGKELEDKMGYSPYQTKECYAAVHLSFPNPMEFNGRRSKTDFLFGCANS